MVNAVANAVHGVDHRNVVIAGGTQPFGFDKHVTRPNVFLRHVLCLNKYLHPYCRSTIQFDAWSTHPYTYGAPTHHAAHKDDVSIGDLPEMGRVLKAGLHYHKIRNWARDARKKAGFIVTEISWDTWRPDPKAVPARMQARWVSLALYRMWRAGVGRVYWFMIKDQPMNDGAGAPPTDLWQSGFYSSTGTLKPYARQAFRFPFVANNRRGVLSVWGRIPPGVHTRSVAIERKTSGGWRRITYARVHAGVFSKSWRSSLAHGAVRARWHGSASLPYSLLKRESSKIYYPFGCGGTRSCS
jgi:hypothetical protein